MSLRSTVFGKTAIQNAVNSKKLKKPVISGKTAPGTASGGGVAKSKSTPPYSGSITPPANKREVKTVADPPVDWDIDALIENYSQYGSLPPMLSPTLPKSVDVDDDIDEIPLNLVSPRSGLKKESKLRYSAKSSSESPADSAKSDSSLTESSSSSTSYKSFSRTEYNGVHSYIVERTHEGRDSLVVSLTIPSKKLARIGKKQTVGLGITFHKIQSEPPSDASKNEFLKKKIMAKPGSASPHLRTEIMSKEGIKRKVEGERRDRDKDHDRQNKERLEKENKERIDRDRIDKEREEKRIIKETEERDKRRKLDIQRDKEPEIKKKEEEKLQFKAGLPTQPKNQTKEQELEEAREQQRQKSARGDSLVRQKSRTKSQNELDLPINHPELSPKIQKQSPNLSQDQLAKNKQILLEKKNHWSSMARDKKHQADSIRETNPKLSAIMNIDSLLLYLIAFDYEDKSKEIMKQLPSERSWNNLVPYVSYVITLTEDLGLESLTGFCFQLRGIIYHHITTILKKVINDYISRTQSTSDSTEKDKSKVNEINEKIIKLQQNFITSSENSNKSLYKGEILCGVAMVSSLYPKTYINSAKRPRPPQYKESLTPNRDQYYLPISSLTSIQEMDAFGYWLINEYIAQHKIDYELELDKKR